MKSTLLRYKIGLAVLLAFAFVMTGLVLVQASGTKQDTKTNSAASDIADKLNTYVDNNQKVPGSLAEAGAKNVPSTISYTKLSDTSYKFCATYKGNSSGFDATGTATDLLSGSGSSSITNEPNIPVDNSYLTIDSTWHKGANCQTINTQVTPIYGNPCTGSGAGSIACMNQNNNANSQQGTLCDYGASSSSNGCVMRCSKATQTTAERIIDGTVTAVTGSGSSTVLTIKDTKNAIHTVSFGPNTQVYDSACGTQDASIFQTDDQVRVVVDAAVVYPGGVNDHVMATEVDDLSY